MVRQRACLRLWAAVGLLAAVTAGCAVCHPSITMPAERDEVVVPLHRAGGMYLVETTINGRPAGHFLLDTGGQCTGVRPKTASELGLLWFWRWTFSGVGGKSSENVRHVGSLGVGDVTVGPHLVGEISFGDVLGGIDGGILGQPLLWDLPFTIDFRRETLTFHRREGFRPPDGVAAAELIFESGRPHVRATINGRHTGWFLMDTGASVHGDLEPQFVARFPEYRPGPEAQRGQAAGIAGRAWFRRGRWSRLDLLDHRFEGVPFDVAEPEGAERAAPGDPKERIGPNEIIGMVGLGLLDEFRLTFDYRGRRLWAEYQGPESVAERRARGADLNAADLHGKTLLHRAIDGGDWTTATDLIAAGVDVSTATREGMTPLMAAAHSGSPDLVGKLLAAGAAANVVNKDEATALMFAAQAGDARSVTALLLHGADARAATKTGITALMAAAVGGNVRAIKAVAEFGADVRAATNEGWTALTAAAGRGKDEAVGALIDLGAEVNATEGHGATALWLACQEGHTAVVSRLIAAGADLNKAAEAGITPLAQACHQEHADVAALLIEAGADLDVADEDGDTALMAAAAHGLADTVRLLVVRGANTGIRNKKGRTAADHAGQYGHDELVALLSGGN